MRTKFAQRLYVLATGEDGPCKIGIAIRPEKRLLELQTGSSLKIRLCWQSDLITHAADLERYLHGVFDEQRLAGEWFSISAERAVAASVEAIRLGTSIPRLKRRGAHLKFRCTREERRLYEVAAARAGLTLSEWARMVARAECPELMNFP